MIKKLVLLAVASFLFAGCASVPLDTDQASDLAKKFNPPTDGNSGMYIFRDSSFGGALKKDVWINGKCIGETAPNVFFYEEVNADEEQKVSTESEFSPNDLVIKVSEGENYFIRQFIKLGLFVGGAGVELVDEEAGKKAVSELKMAKKGTCSQ